MSLLLEGPELVEQLPGEPDYKALAGGRLALALALHALRVLVLLAIGLPLWPLHLALAAIAGHPPHVPRPPEFRRFLAHIWTARPPRPLPVAHRAWLTLMVASKLALTPLASLAWQLDELLYGRSLDAAEIVEPLIELSAARSGSTQLARYLEDDPELLAPAIIQAMFPYLWLWRLVAATLGRVITPAQVDARIQASFRPEFVERHEGHLFRMDTFEVAFVFNRLTGLAFYLGPEILMAEFSLAEAGSASRRTWPSSFVDLSDRTLRKTMVWHHLRGARDTPRLMIKGHFLFAADALAERFPDARFVTVVRHPSPRLRSVINYMRVNPIAPELGPPPWSTLAPALAETEARYCELEHEWFGRRAGPRRCVIRFVDYCDDLEGTMAKVYRECLDADELPPWAPREHAPRERTRYSLNRTLAEVGVDEAALEARLADYIAWIGE